MTLHFKPANKAQTKLRAALFGPSGSGKTYSAWRIATGLGGPGGGDRHRARFGEQVCGSFQVRHPGARSRRHRRLPSGHRCDRLIEKPGEDFGQQLAAWLGDGSPSGLSTAGVAVSSAADGPTELAPGSAGATGAPITIGEEQHRRLEASLRELGLDAHRERLRAWCQARWHLDAVHFDALTQTQYRELDGRLESFAERIAIENEEAA